VGTKLPGDEPTEGQDYVVDVSDIGDRFESQPNCTSFRKQSAGRSSSFENLYELQKKEAVLAAERDQMETGGESFYQQPWQMRDSSEDISDIDSVVPLPIHSLIRETPKSSPIDITMDSGLDRVGQSEGYSRSAPKRWSPHLLQHSISYDMDPDKKRHVVSSVSSLDGNDDSDDFQRGKNATSGTNEWLLLHLKLYLLMLLVLCCESNMCSLLSLPCIIGKPLYSQYFSGFMVTTYKSHNYLSKVTVLAFKKHSVY